MDYKEYKMFVPGPYEFPNLLPLLGRVVVIKGPSLPYSFRSWHFYHCQKKISCEKTIAAHKKLDGQIGANLERQSHYHIIVFPEGVMLDNSILSANNFDVEVNTNMGRTRQQPMLILTTLLLGRSIPWLFGGRLSKGLEKRPGRAPRARL
jgi:hypothetical protein